ncbi:MAG: thioredoxin domain-containing protein [Deltaproteobacteria bacterium]|nr:thioredoxin domain-containing protein [Deltaproteobacteria bacterium]
MIAGSTSVSESLPGAEKMTAILENKIKEMKEKRGNAYKPRTKHLLTDGRARYTNRLFLESSPYLLQHAHNPVNWYSWSDEAFETAQRLKRPVFVSIGYSTCHWCHVMEEESFEDEEIAEYLNKNFISIKVDREERPDVDAIYMSAVQVLIGQGGWPLNVWMTPDRKPFYGGTYFPARDGDRGAGTGFFTLLKKIAESYNTQPDAVEQSSMNLTAAVQKMMTPVSGSDLPDADILHRAASYYKSRFDSKYGGIEGAPKFPSSLPIRFLLRYHRRTNDKETLKMASLTLDKMAGGGMYDHVGGGFHRYSTDREWLVPHFEKMLYDNAILATTYLEGYQATGNYEFRRIVQEILHYIERDMTSVEGAFYSATDADSPSPEGHMEEGVFFTWTLDEIENLLGKERSEIVKKYYAINLTPLFEGRHILNAPESILTSAGSLKTEPDELRKIINKSKNILYDARSLRSRPLRDEKIITSWNGLMISAFARAGLIFGNPSYTKHAVKAARFILANLYKDGRLYRSYKDDTAKHNAYLDDYVFFITALLDLYEATNEIYWLEKAVELDKVLSKHYEDEKNGGFFMTSNDHEVMIAREKPGWDGALPSGNSVAALNLLRLGEFTTNNNYFKRSEKIFKSFIKILSSNPSALSSMLLAVDFYLDTPKEIIIVKPENEKNMAEQFLSEFGKQFLPNSTLSIVTQGENSKIVSGIIPSVKHKLAIDGKTTAYICEKGFCKLPATNPEEFSRQIMHVNKY